MAVALPLARARLTSFLIDLKLTTMQFLSSDQVYSLTY